MRLRWDYLLVLEILLQGNAARHDGCELDEVHKICAGVFGQVFDDLASKKANPSDKASDGRGVDYRLHELVVRHGEVYLGFFFAILTAVGIVAAGAAVEEVVVVVVGVSGFVRLNNTHEGFSDFPVYNKQSSQNCFVEIIHCRYGR